MSSRPNLACPMTVLAWALASAAAIGASPVLAATATAAAPADSAAADADRDSIVVNGAYTEQSPSSGTKSTLPLAETPQSISVITSDAIAQLGIANLNQAMRYVAGITPETRGANAEVYDQFKLRGFDAPVYLDGLKQFASSTGYASPQVDMSRLDRIEVVKGPASALYGQSSPGGLVAMSSKLPLDKDFYGSVAGTYGNYDLYRIDADVGGKFNDAVAVRLYGSINGSATQQTIGSRKRQTLSGAVTVNLDSRTRLTALVAYSHDPKNGNYSGQPGYGTLFGNINGPAPTNVADGEPNALWKREQAATTYILTHNFGGGWNFRSSGRYQHVTSDLSSVYSTGIYTDATQTTFSRGTYATHETLANWTFDNQLSGTVTTGPATHHLMIGLDRQTSHTFEAAAFGSATNYNAYDPVYGTQPIATTPYDISATPTLYNVAQRQTGIYAQDEISWGGLRVLLSGRHDWARTYARTNGIAAVQDDAKFTGRVGVLYKTALGLAPYASYATSFEPQSATLATGGIAKPSMGKQVEVGLKYQPEGSPMLITAAWFHIDQTNVVSTNPVDFTATQSGKYRSEGFEIEADAPLPGGFHVHGAFSHQKVRDVADADARYVGGGLIGAGDGNLSVNLDWTARRGVLKSLNIGAAVRHVDKVFAGVFDEALGSNYKQYYSPSYTVFDAMLHYDMGQADHRLRGMTVGVNVNNLFDKKYLTSCYLYPGSTAWCWYGQRRTVQGTVSWHW